MLHDRHLRGRKFVKKLLEGYLDNNIPHGLIFVGAKDIGKKELAIDFAKRIVCEKNGCGDCKVCKSEEYDLGLIVVNSGFEKISIDEVREWKKELSKTEFGGGSRVMVLENPERMTLEASNAFLKLLEEPGSSVVFVLLTTKLDKLIDTIVSRSVVVKIDRMDEKELDLSSVDNADFDDQEIRNMVMGRSELLKKVNLVKKEQIVSNVFAFWKLVYSDINMKVEFINKIKTNKSLILKYVDFWENCVRELFVYKYVNGDRCWWKDDRLFDLYKKIHLDDHKMLDFIDDLAFVRENIDRGYSKKTLLVDLLLKLYV